MIDVRVRVKYIVCTHDTVKWKRDCDGLVEDASFRYLRSSYYFEKLLILFVTLVAKSVLAEVLRRFTYR